MTKEKPFGVASAVMLAVGSMVGAGIFIVIGEAGSIAGNIVWVSFIFGGVAALLSGYSLAKLALAFPSRGGVVEYLVQSYGEGLFSGSMGILFYISQLIAIAAVAKSFGAYASNLIHDGAIFWTNLYAVGVVAIFTVINLLGSYLVAKSENIIVIVKVTVLTIFTIAALFHLKPQLLSSSNIPAMQDIFFAVGLTFFAYQGFSVITNTVEDMQNPKENMLKSMFIAILLVAVLYIATSIAVLGNLSLDEVIEAKDYALAEAARPIFGELGFKIMAITALIATASAINATLYAATEIGYTMAKEGNLPKFYQYNIINSYEGLIISAILITPMILYLSLTEITTVAALVVLLIQGITHLGHILLIKKTSANLTLVVFATILMFLIVVSTLIYTSKSNPSIGYYLLFAFLSSFLIELLLRVTKKRVIKKQVKIK